MLDLIVNNADVCSLLSVSVIIPIYVVLFHCLLATVAPLVIILCL